MGFRISLFLGLNKLETNCTLFSDGTLTWENRLMLMLRLICFMDAWTEGLEGYWTSYCMLGPDLESLAWDETGICYGFYPGFGRLKLSLGLSLLRWLMCGLEMDGSLMKDWVCAWIWEVMEGLKSYGSDGLEI